MIFNTIQKRSIFSILFGGPLNYTQQFPRLYLASIALIVQIAGVQATFWARLLPMVFGLAGVAAWLFFFYEHFWLGQKRMIPCLVSGGLLIANSYVLYYCYELKSYSADFFFSGLLSSLAQTQLLSVRRRHFFLLCAALISLMFSYTSLFVIPAIGITVLCDRQERQKWQKDWRLLTVFFATGALIVGFLYRIDYRFGEPPGHSGVLHNYWRAFFVQGDSWLQKAASLKNLFEVFITDWWKTDYGPISEAMAENAGYILPLRTFGNPDIRNLVRCGSFLFVVWGLCACFRKKSATESALYLGSVLIGVMAMLSLCQIYPWGMSRLTLYAMPVSILLMVESAAFFTDGLRRLPFLGNISRLIWIPFVWMVFRNGLFFAIACVSAPFPQNIQEAFQHVAPGVSPLLVVSGASDVIVHAYANVPPEVNVLYESEIPQPNLNEKVSGHPFYFLWAHYHPDLNKDGVPNQYANRYTAEPIFVRPPQFGLGLLLLKPKN